MRLTSIKLSGFKSFVDPTTLHLPSNMTGVVGPNGSGKSNIIDAVRWVMGESAASRLRGENLTDVIFSGASGRKPVSQATVELIFDNGEGTLGGEYASFSEISVKRTVSRDGLSAYFLNGTRCRRRDITDLFLGTGLGPRSYSIIEQGMISEIIEARPEDLRVFLEEAAGISKYKERRRETETRMRHTRENLERLNDLREEIDKQIEHLRKQARQAEQYTKLQAAGKEKDAQIKALEYRGLAAELAALRETLGQQRTRLEALIAEQRHAEAELETGRVRHGEAGEGLSRVQGEVYRIGAEIARLEQQIQHQRELHQRLVQDREEAERALAEVDGHLSEDAAQRQSLNTAIAAEEPRMAEMAAADRIRQEELQSIEAGLGDWQTRWNAFAQAQSQAGQAAEVERTRIDYLERQVDESERRRQALAAERGGLDLEALERETEAARGEHDAQQAEVGRLGGELETRQHEHAALLEAQRKASAELAALRGAIQAGRGRLASLEALQNAALGMEKNDAGEWLARQGLARAARLGETLGVEAGWESAVETVLGPLLEAAGVDSPAAHLEALRDLDRGRLALVATAAGDRIWPTDSLAARVRGPEAVGGLLARVRTAEDLERAGALLPGLGEDESVVTRGGEWLGKGWVRVLRSGEAQQGSLLREREIQSLRAELERMARRESELEARLVALSDQLRQAEQQREDAQRSLHQAHRGVSELAGHMQGLRGRMDSTRERIEAIDQELSRLREGHEQAEAGVREARSRLQQALAQMAELDAQRQRLDAEREALSARREAARQAAREAHDQAHRLALGLESRRSQAASLEQALARMHAQRRQLEQRLTELRSHLERCDAPVAELEGQRQTCLDRRVQAEKDLAAARSTLDGIEAELRRHEQVRQQRDQQALAQRESIAALRMQEQALEMHQQQLAEGVAADGLALDQVLAELPETADVETWRKALTDIEARMRRLEPVNLAAIQEFEEQSQRKQYLDAQHADLTSALETLEAAIRKIDRETRGRFKDTFDRVNSGVQELYPRLFGGGHAYLELTGEDLLDTGVAIMARPPGKRISHISLLSGGEKALTAAALVFAIFRLNPAPFCLLDEVDAPLDEANVGRFCALVTEMSEQVQFLVVTHNKTTMEAVRQLSGVTMREPGVSRLVSVDMAEATRLAGAA